MEQENEQKQKRDFRIRKLTERECLRLMDVSEDDINKMMASPLTIPEGADFKEWLDNLSPEDAILWKKKHISKSQLYKMAGNSIVVACLEGIFRQMFRPDYIEDAPIVITNKNDSKDSEIINKEEKPKYKQMSIFDIIGIED